MPAFIKVIKEPLKLLGHYQVQCIIIGGVAATLYGSANLTRDLDVCYARAPENLKRLAEALQSVSAKLRNAPPDIPFILDDQTLKRGLNFTFSTTAGSLDLLGEVLGVGRYEDMIGDSIACDLYGYSFRVIGLEQLIIAKKTAGRGKDLIVLPELEAIRAAQHKASDEC
jgi:predicted nucleotidyltransferase